ncbi:hypothetical protein PaG_05689 [Moesziomyces aphidis]|uniref:DUF3835 domain-containing protein n=1 Tax=Moesziomyces aphidis TaxID=84754 RepID=W3VF13_MOEAP|nr:hypothetical protein PaG_05689 [Moesziomyces aphidis]
MLSSRAAAGGDPTEVSETAQALLKAHYGRLRTATHSSDRTVLARLESAAANLERICLQLDNIQVAHELRSGQSSAQHASRILQPLGALAFWPAQLHLKDAGVFVRQDVAGLSITDQLALEDAALATLTRPAGKERITSSVRLSEPSRTIEVAYVKTSIKDAQSHLQTRRSRFLKHAAQLRDRIAPDSGRKQDEVQPKDMHMVNDQNQALNEEGLPFFEPIEKVSDEEAAQKKEAYMQPFVRDNDERAADKDKRRLWLEQTLSKLEQEEEQEEEEEEHDDADAAAQPSTSAADSSAPATRKDEAIDAAEETRVVLRTRTPSPPPSPEDQAHAKSLPEIVSAARPPPAKSALKMGLARPPINQRPSFGASGIRHGFLNLNPSSPGAIKSSYSWEDLEKEDGQERPSRSHTPTPLSRTSSTAETSLLGRVTDAASSPLTSGTSTPTKKSVRIKSPERAHPEASARSGLTPLQRALRSSIRVKENYADATPEPSTAADAASARVDSGSGTAEKRHRDDVGVEEEAERIVALLGPDVVEGHPSAPPTDVLRQMQQAHEEDKRLSTPEAVAARQKHEEEQREKERMQRLAEKPALGHAVMERPKATGGAAEVKSAANGATKFSAFKKGFLSQKPKFVPNAPGPRVPTAPTESLGMSALDRASMGDDELSARRQAMGLPAAVPHARPSKAYAEKMRQRQEGRVEQEASSPGEGGGKVALARPVDGDDVPRPGRVRFGPPASQQDHDEQDADDGVVEINPAAQLDNHLPAEVDDGRELDEEQEDPKIEGEGADADSEDEYFDSYLSQRSRSAAAADKDWDMDDDFDDDEDEYDYDADDLMALAPSMGGDADGLASHPDLMKEYEQARAKLAAMGLAMPGSSGAGNSSAAVLPADESDDDYEDDVVPLDAAMEDPEYQGNTVSDASGRSRISRFKASLQQRSASAAGASQKLEDLLSSAQNLGDGRAADGAASASAAFGMDGFAGPADKGPVMLIPQLAPVRFPKDGDLVEGGVTGPVALGGADSDDDDEKAEMVMRSRLERREWKQNNPDQARREKENRHNREMVEQGLAPPSVAPRRQAEKTYEPAGAEDGGSQTEEQQHPKPKKVSRFKAARQAQ